jgi:hypothetical protein
VGKATLVGLALVAAAGFAVASIASGSTAFFEGTTATVTTTQTVTTTTPGTTVTTPAPSRRVTICHRTGSRKHPFVTITVSASSLFAHFRHHDLPGRCTAPKIKQIVKAVKAEQAKSKSHHKR